MKYMILDDKGHFYGPDGDYHSICNPYGGTKVYIYSSLDEATAVLNKSLKGEYIRKLTIYKAVLVARPEYVMEHVPEYVIEHVED